MNAALGACPREGGDRLDGLRLKEAYALLREGEVEAAICLVNTLRISQQLEKEVLMFYDEAGLSSGKLPILEQRLSAKLEEISRDSPSLAESLSIIHQLLELHYRKSEATSQCLISLKAEVLNEALAKLGQQTNNALIAQDAHIQRLEEERKVTQQTLSSLRVKVEALTEDLVKAEQASSHKIDQDRIQSLEQDIKQVKRAQDRQNISLDEKLNEVEAATQQTLNRLWGDVEDLLRYLDQTLSQCKQAQLAQEAMLQRLVEQAERTEAYAFTLSRELGETKHSLQDTREALYHRQEVPLPAFIYSYTEDTDQLHRTNQVSGEQLSHQVPSYIFKRGCCWSEVPGGSLLITGGGYPAVSEVVRIDVGTFEVSSQRDMHTPRRAHAAVYHSQHAYVLGGNDFRSLSECERYVCAENRWETLPSLPRACFGLSGVVVEKSLYALGGAVGLTTALDLVQKLSLESLTWKLMQLRLPQADSGIPCFKLRDTEVYLVVKKTLCSFTGLEVRFLSTLTEDMKSWFGASYYSGGILYCSNDVGAARSLEIGSLTGV
jgi:hypothetical protein